MRIVFPSRQSEDQTPIALPTSQRLIIPSTNCHPEQQSVTPQQNSLIPSAGLRVRVKRTCFPHYCTKLLFVLFCLLTSFAAAQNITGTVTNGTTGKPAAGDEVTLLSLSQGMQEIGSTKSDAQGRFSFPAPTDSKRRTWCESLIRA